MKKIILGGIAAIVIAIAAIAFTVTTYGNVLPESDAGGGAVQCTCAQQGLGKCSANGLGVHTCRTSDKRCSKSDSNCI